MSIHPSPSQTTADDNPPPPEKHRHRIPNAKNPKKEIHRRSPLSPLVQRSNPRHPFRPVGTPSPDSMSNTDLLSVRPIRFYEKKRSGNVSYRQNRKARRKPFPCAFSTDTSFRRCVSPRRTRNLVARSYDSLPLIRRGDSPLRATGKSEQDGQNATVYFKVPIADSYSRSRAFRMVFPSSPRK